MFFRIFFSMILLFPFFCISEQWPVPPDNISTPGQNASDQRVAIDLNGNIVAIWIESELIKSCTGSIGSGWNINIDTLSGAQSASPSIVMDQNGNATATWIEDTVVKTSTKPLNGNWSVTPSTLSGAGVISAEVAIDVSGNLVVVWDEMGTIKSATKLMNGDWPLIPDTLSIASGSFPQVSIGANGSAVCVWQGLDNATSTIYAASKMIAGSWEAPFAISSVNVQSCYPHIAVDPSGTAVAVWFKYQISSSQYSQVVIQSSSQPFNGSWSAPVDISDPGTRNPEGLALHVVSNVTGIACAAWTNSYDGNQFLGEWNLLTNGTWLAQPQVIEPPNFLARDLHLAMDYAGDVYIGWMKYDPTSSTIIIPVSINDAKSYSPGFCKTWILSAGGGNAYPFGAVSINGQTIYAVATWVNNNGMHDRIQAIIMSFVKILPPSNLSVMTNVNDFRVLSTISNVLNWEASPSSDIVVYLVYRNGVYLGWVDPANLQYVDLNRTVGETTTYEVAAVDVQGRQSELVAISFTN